MASDPEYRSKQYKRVQARAKRKYHSDPEYKERVLSKKRIEQKLWRLNNPERDKQKQRRNQLSRKYGITPDQYKEMLIAQDFRCAICLKPFGEKRVPFIDHNHFTDMVRQILCPPCNSLLGLSYEDPEILLSAIRYIKKHNSESDSPMMLPEAET